MNNDTIRTITTGVISLILVGTASAISYRIIDAYCQLGASMSNPEVSLDALKVQMQSLKDWGGIVLGFFFGAGFNFIVLAFVGKSSQLASSPVEK